MLQLSDTISYCSYRTGYSARAYVRSGCGVCGAGVRWLHQRLASGDYLHVQLSNCLSIYLSVWLPVLSSVQISFYSYLPTQLACQLPYINVLILHLYACLSIYLCLYLFSYPQIIPFVLLSSSLHYHTLSLTFYLLSFISLLCYRARQWCWCAV